jgi:hypothetical protein
VITYASETWALEECMKRKLLKPARKISRRIFECTWDRDDTWRIKGNDELNNLIINKNVINYIKAQRFSWFGHVYRMTNDGMVKKII